MKRNFFIILTILLIISAIVGCTVYNYRRTQANIEQYNKNTKDDLEQYSIKK